MRMCVLFVVVGDKLFFWLDLERHCEIFAYRPLNHRPFILTIHRNNFGEMKTTLSD